MTRASRSFRFYKNIKIITLMVLKCVNKVVLPQLWADGVFSLEKKNNRYPTDIGSSVSYEGLTHVQKSQISPGYLYLLVRGCTTYRFLGLSVSQSYDHFFFVVDRQEYIKNN